MNVLLIALGGSIGAVARYGLAGLVQRFTTPYFPFGTFVVNMVGCFVFGILAGVAEHRFALGPQARAFLLIGVIGFGANSRVHTAKVLRLSEDLPVVIEIVDGPDKIEAFLPALDEMVQEGLVTLERAKVIHYRHRTKKDGS